MGKMEDEKIGCDYDTLILRYITLEEQISSRDHYYAVRYCINVGIQFDFFFIDEPK